MAADQPPIWMMWVAIGPPVLIYVVLQWWSMRRFKKTLDGWLDRIHARFDRIDARFDRIDAHIDRIDASLDRLETQPDHDNQPPKPIETWKAKPGLIAKN